MAVITSALLNSLRTGFSAAFQRGKTKAAPMWDKVATLIPSTAAQNTYGWLGQFPKLREWDASLLVAVDQDYAKRGTALHEGAEVAIMPPVQGG